MKNWYLFSLTLFIISTSVIGQTTGDFRSAQSGNWGDLTTWQTWNGSAWIAASVIPDSNTSGAVAVRSTHNVTVAATIGIRNVNVNSGGTVTINGEPVVLYITQEGMTVNGTITLTGNVAAASPYSIAITTGTLIIGTTGVVNYNQTAAVVSTKGALPTATWQTGATLNINSTGGTGATGWGAGTAQNFYNVNWNCPLMTGNFGWGFTSHTIGGTVSILATNTGRVQFFGGSSGTLDIMGDFVVSGAANATVNGTSGGTNDTINIYGKVNINTTGNFSISRGSQGGIGTSILNLYGDSVKIVAGTMQNSNSTPDGAKFIFKKNGIQYLTLIPTVLTGNALPIEIGAGSTVTLLSPVNVTTLYLNGGIIASSVSNPLIMGWWNSTASTLTSGNVSATAPGSSTSFISGPMAYLYATAAGTTSKTYPIGKGSNYRPLTVSLTQTAATLSTYTAEFFNAAPPTNTLPGTLDKVSTVGHFKISEAAGGSAFTAGSVLLNYSLGDGVNDAPNLRIAQGPNGGGTWVDLGGTGNGTPAGTITSTIDFTDLTTKTVFTLANHTGGSNSLPVELSSFTITNSLGNIQVNWITSTEKNCSMFEIQRALLKGNWITAGTIKASGTSTSTNNYSFTEKNLQTGKYLYRLIIIDYDGSYNYSAVEETEVLAPNSFTLNQNYPNPFNPSTRINYSIPLDSKVVLDIYNLAGERITQLVNKEQSAGYYSVDFNASLVYKSISSGVYFYKLTVVEKNSGKYTSVVKKMMLIK